MLFILLRHPIYIKSLYNKLKCISPTLIHLTFYATLFTGKGEMSLLHSNSPKYIGILIRD